MVDAFTMGMLQHWLHYSSDVTMLSSRGAPAMDSFVVPAEKAV
jgi:hypothetical protein